MIEDWIQACKEEDFAEELAGVRKRLVISSQIFEHDGRKFRAKYYRTFGIKRKLEAAFIRSESIRSFHVGIRLGEAGILTPRPLCVWGRWSLGLHEWSVLFMEDLAGDLQPLPKFLDALDHEDIADKTRVGLALARALARLHEANVYIHDAGKNILVDDKGTEILFYFIDFDTVVPFRRLTLKRVARTLRHCIRPPQHPTMYEDQERTAYVKEYLKARGHPEWFDSIFPKV